MLHDAAVPTESTEMFPVLVVASVQFDVDLMLQGLQILHFLLVLMLVRSCTCRKM